MQPEAKMYVLTMKDIIYLMRTAVDTYDDERMYVMKNKLSNKEIELLAFKTAKKLFAKVDEFIANKEMKGDKE